MPNGYGFSDRVHHKVLFVKRLCNDRPGKLNRDHYESARPLDTNARATLPRKPCYAISGVSQHIFGDGGSCHGRSGWRPGPSPTRSSCSVPLYVPPPRFTCWVAQTEPLATFLSRRTARQQGNRMKFLIAVCFPRKRGEVTVQCRLGQGDSRSSRKKGKPPAAETVLRWIPAFAGMTCPISCDSPAPGNSHVPNVT